MDQPTVDSARRDIVDAAPCGLVQIAWNGDVQFANAGFLKIAGIEKPLPESFSFQRFLAPGSLIFYEAQFLPSLLLRGALNEISFDLIRPNFVRVPAFVNAVVRNPTNGGDASILLAVFESGQRRMYENELLRIRASSEQMVEVVRRSSDAIVALTPDGTIQAWNSGAEKMFGIERDEAVGRDLEELLFQGKERGAIAEAMTILRNGLEVNKEVVGRHRDGREINLSVSLTPHMEAPGTLVAFSAIVRDITSRKLSEKALIQSEKLASVGRLASSIAHEINNPLESVTNLLYILQSQVEGSENRALVNLAQEELARVSQITTHTLRFHRQSTHRTLLDVTALFDSVLALYRGRLQNNGITPIVKAHPAPPLLCYEGEMRQIVVNLVGNAFDAMRLGGRLMLRSRSATLWKSGAKGVRITIADTGTGMSPEIVQRIFEPFFTTKGIGGTGLGMWITLGLVEKNNGSIRVRSCLRPGRAGTVIALLFAEP